MIVGHKVQPVAARDKSAFYHKCFYGLFYLDKGQGNVAISAIFIQLPAGI
jgi:hypothetical protein